LTTWQTVSAACLPLPDRENAQLKLEFVGGGFRLNWFQFGSQMPYLGAPMPIPGRVQFEDYDIGGQQISYYDKTNTNGYLQYRPSEFVDIMPIVDGGVMGYAPFMEASEWMEYTCAVESGHYTIVVRSSSPYAAQQLGLSIDGQTLTTFTLPNSGQFFNFQNTAIPNVYLPGGEQVLRFTMLASSGVVNYVDYIRQFNAADITKSGRVDMDDLSVLAAQWLGVPSTPSADIAPAGGDGAVDLPDLLLMAENES
jgi:hypothetical protein